MLRNANISCLRLQHLLDLNCIQKRTSFYNRYKHGPLKVTNLDPPYLQWAKDFFGREGVQFVKDHTIRLIKKPFESTLPKHREVNKTYIFEHFDSDESVKKWKPVADSDSFSGFSSSSIVRSPAGHGLFKGVIDNRCPEDGLTQNSGFAGIIGPRRQGNELGSIEYRWDWSDFNTLEIKFRGDGRKYSIAVNTATYTSDLEFYDIYHYPLYTRGGPYWQTIRIPFSKFVFVYKAFVQDDQVPLLKFRVKFVALTLEDKVDGPFALEIDYLGLRNEVMPFDEETAYESYSYPHMDYTQVNVDCEPPES